MMAHKTGSMGIGLLVGVGLGAALGVLFAPRKGQETRQQIQQKIMGVRDRMKQQVSQKMNKAKQASNKTNDVKEAISRQIGSASNQSEGERPR